MKQSVTQNAFYDAFISMGRKDNFSYEGLNALYDYFEELDESCGTETELDVIAICCEYSEDEPEYFLEQYSLDSIEDLRNHTSVIDVPGRTSIIIQDY